jgi:hypothetical protein
MASFVSLLAGYVGLMEHELFSWILLKHPLTVLVCFAPFSDITATNFYKA